MTGDGTAELPLAVSFEGSGAAATASRSDHTHPYLPLSVMSETQATTLVSGANADLLHTHSIPKAGWFNCGKASDLVGCEMPSYPVAEYAYGLVYNSTEPHEINCLTWNVGRRLANRHPYFVNSDNPETGMNWGGVMFYTGTNATDDDTCTGTTPWRHRYWLMSSTNTVAPGGSNGCADPIIYCRERR